MIEEQEGETLDARLISAAQRVEHYEIAAYGCVRTYANLGNRRDAGRSAIRAPVAAAGKFLPITGSGVQGRSRSDWTAPSRRWEAAFA